jgi:hypothetical protein
MSRSNENQPAFELGALVGRRQAFGLIANKCSAADAECLRRIRDTKSYKSLGLNWDEFCPLHLGLSRAHADKIIQRLEEFGAAYFELSQLVRIPEQAYRAISGAVVGHAIEYKGETIPISEENAARIAEVIKLLRGQSEEFRQRIELAESASEVSGVDALRKRLDSCISQLASLDDQAAVALLVEYCMARLELVRRALGAPVEP